MRHRPWRPAFAVAAFISILLAYGIYARSFGRQMIVHGFWGWGSRPKHMAHDAEVRLNASLQSPISISNFTAMGDRMAAFAKLSEALVQDRSLDRTTLLSALSHQFPWWKTDKTRYAPWLPPPIAQTGLVVCVGSNNFLVAAHSVRILRNVLNSTLHIEIFYAGENDLSGPRQTDLKALDANLETVDLLEYYDDSSAGLQTGGYAMKPFAALASRFEKVILVDADVVFLQRPDNIFDENLALKDTGTLFWHDRAYTDAGDFSRRDWIKGLLDGRQPSALLSQSIFWQEDLWQEMDSGVVCIDKSISTAFMGLLFATWMNSKEIREDTVYKAVLGDKETYWFAHELASFPYSYISSAYAGAVGSIDASAATAPSYRTICSVQILHVNQQRTPFWFNGSLRKNKTNKDSREFATLSHWIEGTSTWQTMPKWRYVGDNAWCAEGIVGSGAIFEPVIAAMISEAKTVDQMFPES